MTPSLPAVRAFVKEHGIVLESGKGPVANVAEFIVGQPIKGNWWGHPQGNLIFNLTRQLRDCPELLVCRLVKGKVTYVHKRLWPALIKLARRFKASALAAIDEQHTSGGAHKVVTLAFAKRMPAAAKKKARALSMETAQEQLANIL